MITDRDDEFRGTVYAAYASIGRDRARISAAELEGWLQWCREGDQVPPSDARTGERLFALFAASDEGRAWAARPPIPPPSPTPALHVEGRELVTAAGARHMIVGSTELLLAWMYDVAGADATRPIFEERQAIGFNNLRVLWQKDIGNAGQPWQMPIGKLRPFLALGASYSSYIQGAILADCQVVNPNEADQQARVGAVREETVGVDNHIEQLGNEWEKNGHEPRHFGRPTDRLAMNSSSIEGGTDAPYWDLFGFSGQRSPTEHAIREYGPLQFMYADGRPWGGVPAICDEGFKPGVQSSDPRDWERAGAQARSGCGGRFHSLAGTEAPRLFNDVERACAIAFVRGLRG